MTLQPPQDMNSPHPTRQLLHTRQVTLSGYRRSDGLYEIEGHLVDTKTYDRPSRGTYRRAGEPVHEMVLKITIGTDFVIRDAHAESRSVPYGGACDSISADYRKLIGMTVKPGFLQEVRNVLGGVKGCTHLTEMIGGIATTAYQTMGEEISASSDERPFQLNSCHALKIDGQVVKLSYPQWFRASNAS